MEARTVIALSDGMDGRRSPVDGMWRVWAYLQANISQVGTPIWACLGVNKKLKEAHQEAKNRRRSLIDAWKAQQEGASS